MKYFVQLLVALGALSAAFAQTATITPSTTTYAATGGNITFTVTITYPNTASSIGLEIGTAPAGWKFADAGGTSVPQIAPAVGTTSPFDFAYTSIPASPVSFTFTLTYPAALSGNQTLSGIFVTIRTGAGAGIVDLPNIVIGPDTGGGGGSPVPPAIVAPPTGATIDEGATLTLSVSASGTAPLSYQWSKDGVVLPGQTLAQLSLTKVTVAQAGSYTVSVTNTAGTVTSAPAVVVVRAAVVPPQITIQPVSITTSVGETVTFSVGAIGTAPLGYQWSKDGAAIPGETNASLVLAKVQGNAAGRYAVMVSNSAGRVSSADAILVVLATAVGPQITGQPQAVNALMGGTATFAVTVSGTAPLTYQWFKDGTNLAGQTAASLSLTNLQAAAAGNYRVVVTNSAGSVSSQSAALVVAARPIAGTYFGSIAGETQHIALLVRADRSGAFVGYLASRQLGLYAANVVVDASGGFHGAADLVGAPGTVAIDGTIGPDGALVGTAAGLGALLGAPSEVGATPTLAGFYQAAVARTSAISYGVIGPDGKLLLVTGNAGNADAASGTVDANGLFDRPMAVNGRMFGQATAGGLINFQVISTTGSALNFTGANNDARSAMENLVNISTRSQTGTEGGTLIAGFAIAGTQAKTVLIRGVGPTLGSFGVGGALAAVHLDVFHDTALVTSADSWGGAPDAAAIAAAAARVGAFALPAQSADSALMLALPPGSYTAVLRGQGSATGVGLLEIYDATVGAIQKNQRMVNISTRSLAGAGERALVAGFVVTGTVPKRVLVRGAGPALTAFGVTGAVARLRLSIFDASGALVAQNLRWSGSADAVAVEQAAARVGAFAFAAGSDDTALVLSLAPGGYTAQVNGLDATGTTSAEGVALVEVYEVP